MLLLKSFKSARKASPTPLWLAVSFTDGIRYKIFSGTPSGTLALTCSTSLYKFHRQSGLVRWGEDNENGQTSTLGMEQATDMIAINVAISIATCHWAHHKDLHSSFATSYSLEQTPELLCTWFSRHLFPPDTLWNQWEVHQDSSIFLFSLLAAVFSSFLPASVVQCVCICGT